MKQSSIIIVIPAYNEEGNIGYLIHRIREKLQDVDILVIDDGSADRTARAAEKAGAIVACLPFNMGYGAALQTGFKYALRNRYQFVIQMDADGQHDPESALLLLTEIKKEDADVVIGSRFLDGGGSYRTTLSKKIGMGLFGKLATMITGKYVSDPTSGFQALNRDALRFYASRFYPVDYPDADVLIMLHKAGLHVKEVPVIMHARQHGKSMHSGLKPVYYIFKMLLSMFVTLLRNDRFVRRVVKKEEIPDANSAKDICNKY